MRYATAAAFRRALEQRLLTQSNELDIPLIRLRKLVVFDRLMARLAAVALGRWVLKGAVALHFRSGPQFRTTKDLDLGRQDDEEAATADFRLAQSTDLGDYFSFNVERTARLDPALEGVAVRYHVSAELDGRAFEDVTVDVGFGEGSWSEAEGTIRAGSAELRRDFSGASANHFHRAACCGKGPRLHSNLCRRSYESR